MAVAADSLIFNELLVPDNYKYSIEKNSLASTGTQDAHYSASSNNT